MDTLTKIADAMDKVAGAKIAACIVYKNSIASFGMNQMKSHPFQAKYSKNKESIFLHAETSAIHNALKVISVEEFKKSTLYICRVKYGYPNNTMCWGVSRPCAGCMRAIATFGIRRVIYSNDGSGYTILQSPQLNCD